MPIRPFSKTKDAKNAHRIWQEIGWIKKDEKDEKAMDILINSGNADIFDIGGSAECLVSSIPGTILYNKKELSFSAITSVTTSRIARGMGIAGKVLGNRIAKDVDQGTKVAGLGMFEQGFYNRLGFGTGCYENWISFDPANLNIKIKHAPPLRLGLEDWKDVFECFSKRQLFHGGINVNNPGLLKSFMHFSENGFGLGYRTKQKLTHFIWIEAKDVEMGPYVVLFMAYKNSNQYLELLSLLKSLNSNVRMIELREPRRLQFQDFLKKPFYYSQITEKSKLENKMNASAYWQIRITNLKACIKAVHAKEESLEFNLRINDPIEEFLPKNSKWKGCGGDYTVKLSQKSELKKGHTKKLPLLSSSIGAFSRMWMGVLPASSLIVSENITGPANLISRLDEVFNLPFPDPDLDY